MQSKNVKVKQQKAEKIFISVTNMIKRTNPTSTSKIYENKINHILDKPNGVSPIALMPNKCL